MIAAGLLWCKSSDIPGTPVDSPTHSNADDFLIGNPYIQGSNPNTTGSKPPCRVGDLTSSLWPRTFTAMRFTLRSTTSC